MTDSDQKTIQDVWEKGHEVPPNDPNEWRKDDCGAWIFRGHYGNRDSMYGWEIDHIVPQSKEGGDGIENLRPLQWKNNASRQDGPLVCKVRADSTVNVEI